MGSLICTFEFNLLQLNSLFKSLAGLVKKRDTSPERWVYRFIEQLINDFDVVVRSYKRFGDFSLQVSPFQCERSLQRISKFVKDLVIWLQRSGR